VLANTLGPHHLWPTADGLDVTRPSRRNRGAVSFIRARCVTLLQRLDAAGWSSHGKARERNNTNEEWHDDAQRVRYAEALEEDTARLDGTWTNQRA
jgi:hypothetical protein